jgi:hypothetical protein
MLVNTASAQIVFTSNLYGNDEQPGHRLHLEIISLLNRGDQAPIKNAIDTSLEDENSLLSSEAKKILGFDVLHANNFYAQMTKTNNLIEVTKHLLEAKPDMASHTIALVVVLYPDFTQEIYNGALLTGVLANEDLIAAFLDAGAKPKSLIKVSKVGPSARDIKPIGSGIGAGGTGSGDATASTN